MDLSLVLLVSVWLIGAAQAAQPAPTPPPAPTLRPVDDAASMPDFFVFRARLLAAIARRDAPALLEIVDPQIKNGFGGDDGKEAFVQQWRPSAPDSDLWETLATVLALGGAKAGEDTFIAPYVYTAWPRDVDSFEHIAVVGEGVPVRRAPRSDAAELARVSFEVLPRSRSDEPPDGWTAVTLADGRRGYVTDRQARSPIDYRAFFTRRDGRWWMTMLLAGD